MSDRISLKEKIGYGLGDTASNFVFNMVTMYLTFFYTDIFGIPAAAMGTLFLFSRIWDAVNDPIMGAVADRTNTKWGKFRPYLLWFAVPFAFLAFLTFSTPSLSGGGKIVYAWVTYILLMMAYTAINIPYSALSGVITADHRERTTLSAFRMGLANVGGLIVAAGTLPLVGMLGKGDQAKGFSLTMGVYGIIAVILFFICFSSTKERVAPPAGQKTSLKEDLRMLTKNRPWIIIFLVGVATFTFFIVRMGVVMYYFTYVVGDQSRAGLFMTLGSVTGILAVILTKPVSSLLGKKGTFILGQAVAIASYVVFYYVSPQNLGLLYALQVIGTAGMMMTVPLLWAMIGDTADYAEWKFNMRKTGIVFSAATFSHKFGMGLGGALTGALLTFFGYQAGAAQSAQAVNGLRLMMSYVPAAGCALTILLMLLYPLNDDQCDTMKNELAGRRLAYEA